VEGKPCQAKHKCKTYALTFKLVKSEGRKARGNPSDFSVCRDVPGNCEVAWIATALRASLLTR
jgi:hypothetical protein